MVQSVLLVGSLYANVKLGENALRTPLSNIGTLHPTDARACLQIMLEEVFNSADNVKESSLYVSIL